MHGTVGTIGMGTHVFWGSGYPVTKAKKNYLTWELWSEEGSRNSLGWSKGVIHHEAIILRKEMQALKVAGDSGSAEGRR